MRVVIAVWVVIACCMGNHCVGSHFCVGTVLGSLAMAVWSCHKAELSRSREQVVQVVIWGCGSIVNMMKDVNRTGSSSNMCVRLLNHCFSAN